MAKILCVDDKVINMRLLNLVLSRAGHESVNAHDGETAVSLVLAGSHVFDAIFMDIHMPGINGIVATQRLRSSGCTIPIVALTAYSEPKYRDDMLLVGADSFMLKPFSISAIHETLRQFGIYPTGNI